jgi:hypothetical protein
MNADTAAQVNARHALKLRVVRHKYAASIAAHARAMERHAHMLVRLHASITTESIVIAGPAYEEYHTVGFDANGSIAKQQDTDTCGAVSGAGLANVFQMANDMANRAGEVAACAVPPSLHFE